MDGRQRQGNLRLRQGARGEAFRRGGGGAGGAGRGGARAAVLMAQSLCSTTRC